MATMTTYYASDCMNNNQQVQKIILNCDTKELQINSFLNGGSFYKGTMDAAKIMQEYDAILIDIVHDEKGNTTITNRMNNISFNNNFGSEEIFLNCLDEIKERYSKNEIKNFLRNKLIENYGFVNEEDLEITINNLYSM